MTAASHIIDLLGGTAKTAGIARVKPPSVSEWRRTGIPDDKLTLLAPHAEAESSGALVCEQLCPEVSWIRVPDARWPHPQGRPCIDVAANVIVEPDTGPANVAPDHTEKAEA